MDQHLFNERNWPCLWVGGNWVRRVTSVVEAIITPTGQVDQGACGAGSSVKTVYSTGWQMVSRAAKFYDLMVYLCAHHPCCGQ